MLVSMQSPLLALGADQVLTVDICATMQESPPKPRSESPLRVVRSPEFDAYVLPFSGWATDRRVERIGLAFRKQILKYHPHEVLPGVMMIAQYDSPFKLLFRHNEVWLVRRRPLAAAAVAAASEDATSIPVAGMDDDMNAIF